MSASFRTRPRELAKLREAVAYGFLNFGHAVETDAKRDTVVRGGHRSFMTMKNADGSAQVGGTLRRSVHTAAHLDGQQIGGVATDENGAATPAYAAGPGIRVFVGTNSGYGFWVDQGTSKMPARPALVPALLKNKGDAPALIAAGARKKLGQ
jgi:hypothetical protein